MKEFKKDILTKLYREQQLTAFEIAEIYHLPVREVIDQLKQLNIDPKPTEKKYRLAIKRPLSDQQRQFVTGLLLGEHSRLVKSSSGYALLIKSKSKDHLLWMKTILGAYINVINERNDGYVCQTCQLNDLSFFAKLLYQNNKKIIRPELADYLTNQGLAVWFGESGKVFSNNVRFTTRDFSKAENETLQNILNVNFEIRSKVCEYKKNNHLYYYLSLNKRHSQRLMEIIGKLLRDFVPNSMNDGKDKVRTL